MAGISTFLGLGDCLVQHGPLGFFVGRSRYELVNYPIIRVALIFPIQGRKHDMLGSWPDKAPISDGLGFPVSPLSGTCGRGWVLPAGSLGMPVP